MPVPKTGPTVTPVAGNKSKITTFNHSGAGSTVHTLTGFHNNRAELYIAAGGSCTLKQEDTIKGLVDATLVTLTGEIYRVLRAPHDKATIAWVSGTVTGWIESVGPTE